MADPLAEVERAMIAIRRGQARRTLSRLARERTGSDVDAVSSAVLDAVESAAERQEPATVTALAAGLGVDQPRASRMVAKAVGDGLLSRETDQGDGRRAVLVLTDAGRAELARMHEFRRAMFAEVMADWPEADRVAFGRLLGDFARRFAELGGSGPLR